LRNESAQDDKRPAHRIPPRSRPTLLTLMSAFRPPTAARAEYEQGHYPAAESALRKVLEVREADPLLLNNLGVVLAAEAKYAEAEPLYQRALEIDEKALGPDHPAVATHLSNLAALYYHEGKYAQAEPANRTRLPFSFREVPVTDEFE